jgi:hypothetical protein
VKLEGNEIESASLVSIREKDRPPLGNIPMGLNFDLSLVRNGGRYLPYEMSIELRSGAELKNPATQYLSFRADGRLNRGGTSEYSANLECSLQDLLGTDVGRRLGLEGRLGGRLQGNVKLIGEVNGAWTIDAKMDSSDAFAMVTNPNDPKGAAVRQPLPLHFESHASAQPTPAGGRLDGEPCSLRWRRDLPRPWHVLLSQQRRGSLLRRPAERCGSAAGRRAAVPRHPGDRGRRLRPASRRRDTTECTRLLPPGRLPAVRGHLSTVSRPASLG